MKYAPYPSYKTSDVSWLGHIPEHWEVKRGRFAFEVNPPSPALRSLDDSSEVSFVPMESVGEWGGLDLNASSVISEASSGYTAFQDGDVVVAKITPCFENGKGALARGLLNGAALGTTELHVLRASASLDERFLFYVSISQPFRKLGEAEMYGAGGQKRVPTDFAKDFRLGLPTVEEQRAIAAFLDAQTAKIDTLVEKKQALIEKLKDQRTALISRTVTRGLPPEAARAAGLDPHPRLNPSGIEWLGDVPEHWSATELRYVAEQIVDCPHETPDYAPDGDYVVIRTADVSPGVLDFTAAYRVDELQFLARIRRLALEPGDLVYTREGERYGLAALVPAGTPCCLGQRMMQIRAGAASNASFLMWQMNSDATYRQAQLATAGATAPHVNVDTVRRFQLTLPPPGEQAAIAEYLTNETALIDTMIAKANGVIDRLREYCAALVTDAVTGKINVSRHGS